MFNRLFNFLRRPAIWQFSLLLVVSAVSWFFVASPWRYVLMAAAGLAFFAFRLLAWAKRVQGLSMSGPSVPGEIDDESEAPNQVSSNGDVPELEMLYLIQNTGWQGGLAGALHISLPWTASAEQQRRVRRSRILSDFSYWDPTEGHLERDGAQIRVLSVAARGGEGKTLLTGGTAGAVNWLRCEGALVLDVNPKGSIDGRFPVKKLPHDYTIYDLAQACHNGEVKSVNDFAKYTLRTDAGLRVARRPHFGQPELSSDDLMAILDASEPIFPMVWMDGGNTLTGVMYTAVQEADVCMLSVNPASASLELALSDAADLMRMYPSKPILTVLNQKVPATSQQVDLTIAEFTRPSNRYHKEIRRSFKEHRPDGLHMRVLRFVPELSDDRPLWVQNIPQGPLGEFEEIGATLIDLAIGRETLRLPPGKEAKEVAPAAVIPTATPAPTPPPTPIVEAVVQAPMPPTEAPPVAEPDIPVSRPQEQPEPEQMPTTAEPTRIPEATTQVATPPVQGVSEVPANGAAPNAYHPAPTLMTAVPSPAAKMTLAEIAKMRLGPGVPDRQINDYIARLFSDNETITETNVDDKFDPSTIRLPATV